SETPCLLRQLRTALRYRCCLGRARRDEVEILVRCRPWYSIVTAAASSARAHRRRSRIEFLSHAGIVVGARGRFGRSTRQTLYRKTAFPRRTRVSLALTSALYLDDRGASV